MKFEVNKLTNDFGSEVVGLDLSKSLAEEDFATVKNLYFD